MRTIRGHLPAMSVSPIFMFSILIFLIGLGDAIMSYTAPVYIEKSLGNVFIMGLVLSFSSLVGVIADFMISEKQWAKDYRFFIKITLYLAILFPLSLFFLPPTLFVFLCAMFFWGLYYEYKSFSNFNFIHHFLPRSMHASGWGIITASLASAYFLGPIIAANIISIGYKFTFGVALIPIILAFVIFKIFLSLFSSKTPAVKKDVKVMKKSMWSESKILSTLWHRVWPLFLFSFFLMVVDSCFWTIGTLLSEDLKTSNWLGAYILGAYMLPAIFSGLIPQRIYENFGKKRTAFINGLIASLFLVAMGSTQSVEAIFAYVLLSSVFLTIATVLHTAVIEDFVARLDDFGSDMVSMEQISRSIAYIIGPALLGYIAQYLGYQQTFVITGILMGLISAICLFIVPRKVKLPQTELKKYV